MTRLASSAHTRLSVDLDVVAANLKALRRLLPPGSRVAGVVKADAYGHGLVPVARRLQAEGCHALAVANAGEGAALRAAGLAGPVFLLLGLDPQEAAQVVRLHLTPVVDRLEPLEALAAAARAQGRRADCQVKLDTGMGRLGLKPGEILNFLAAADGLGGLKVTGLVSHLATGGEPDSRHAADQASAFSGVLAAARAAGHALPDSSLGASGAALAPVPGLPEPPIYYRLGIGLYGGLPSPGAGRAARAAGLATAMRLESRLIKVSRVPAGTTVSYGCTWTAPTETVLGVVPVGYADGYPRLASNRGQVLVRGLRRPIRGRVCMNMMVVELGLDEPPPRVGEPVVLLGGQGGDGITGDELAGWAETISYEVFCALGAAVPRSGPAPEDLEPAGGPEEAPPQPA